MYDIRPGEKKNELCLSLLTDCGDYAIQLRCALKLGGGV